MGKHSAEVFQQICATCELVFQYKLSKNGRHRIFCSRPCFNQGQRGAGRYAPPPRLFKQTATCESCSAEMPKKTSTVKWCRECVPDRTAAGRMLRYGISHQTWLEMVSLHGGKCWLCRESEAAVVDHCHSTGRVRGALCNGCNGGLGYFEKTGWAALATAYLG